MIYWLVGGGNVVWEEVFQSHRKNCVVSEHEVSQCKIQTTMSCLPCWRVATENGFAAEVAPATRAAITSRDLYLAFGTEIVGTSSNIAMPRAVFEGWLIGAA